jgi:hypothetical protein
MGLIVLGTIAALVGGVTLYLRSEVIDSAAFADRTVDAIHKPAVQEVVSREMTVQLLEPAFPDAIAGRPLVQSAVQVAISTEAFETLLRVAALHGHRLLFQPGGGNVVFDIADAATVISSALQKFAPKIAAQIPKRTEAVLMTLKKRSFAGTTLRVANAVRILGIVLPIVAVALFVAALAIAPDRRRGLMRMGVAVGVAGIALAIGLGLLKRALASNLIPPPELSPSQIQAAFGALWDSYLGDLTTWTLVIAAAAWVVAAAARPIVAPYAPAAGLKRLPGAVLGPAPSAVRAVRSAVALALGLLAILNPILALRLLAIAGGAVLLYIGAGEVLALTAPAEPRPRRVRKRRSIERRQLLTAGGLALVCIAIVTFLLVFNGGTKPVEADAPQTCNGYAQLCSRRLDEVVFAGTHNSMSAADSPGWLIANQDRAVNQQLQDGIRLFKISTHYAVASASGSGAVYTDLVAEGDRLNRVASKLSPVARLALQRVSRSLAKASTGGKRDIYLCHTLCELGATRMIDFLEVIHKFLEANPNQVIILFDEDYVAEKDIRMAFKRAGLFDNLATLHRGQPLPTLGSLIRSRHNVVLFSQKPTSGKYGWNTEAFESGWISDTPLGATKPSQFSCALARGRIDAPLLMMNNWADLFPPRPTPNVPLVQAPFILQRARECVQLRGHIPNLILTDYYNRGQVVQAVAELNGVENERPAPTTPVGPP